MGNHERPANADMIEGYLDGAKDDRAEFPKSLSNRGAAYRHGWLNGRADRVGKTRWGSLDEALRCAEEAMRADELPGEP